MMNDVTEYFHETQEGFTIYVVEQRFVVGRGHEYFKSFIGKENLIIDDTALTKRIKKILIWTQRCVPDVSELIKYCMSAFTSFKPVTIIDIITALSNLFSVEKHQAVGPEIIDPLIIQEGKVTQKNLAQLVSLNKESILQPTIIILLSDNNFDRAKELLSKCPSGINAKFIRNSGETTIYKIINSGANDSVEFINLFSRQCFSTCSATNREVLLSSEYENSNIISSFAPQIMRFRSLLIEENNSRGTLKEINDTISELTKFTVYSSKEEYIKKCFLCMLILNKTYCMYKCIPDMKEAFNIASSLNNEILNAHVLRYSNFLSDVSYEEKNNMLKKASDIFEKNKIEDHSIYCVNNYLINSFYTDSIDAKAFWGLQERAVCNVPGLVGMSYIFNNAGVAFIYCHNYDEAIELLDKGLPYARFRPLQKYGIMTNLLIAKRCNGISIEKSEIIKIVCGVFDLFGCSESPFLTANYIVNTLSIAASADISFAKELIYKYPIIELINNALNCGKFATGSLSLLLFLLQEKYSDLFPCNFKFPNKKTPISGIRMRFLENHTLHPAIFNAWL